MNKGVLLVVAVAQLVALTWGQTVDVNHPVLGHIVGRQGVTSRDQKEYWTFHGIPYADPESYMGVNRFKPSAVYRKPLNESGPFHANKIWMFCPQDEILDLSAIIPKENDPEPEKLFSKAQDLTAIYQAIHKNKRKQSEIFRSFATDEDRKKAFQAEPVPTMGREDCLTININTPNIPEDGENPGELLPVIVFYHGGGSDSVWGSAFTALRLLEDPVVLVTMNYRLGVLGALNLGTDDAPGCAGMYDSVTALEWVQEYISYFGGDPKRVTISGQSAGAMIVANLVTTPITKDRDLFHGVWGFSGSAISVWAVSEHPSLDNHLEIAELADCYHPESATPEDIPTIIKCMQEASLETLVTAKALWQHREEATGRLGFDAKMPSIQAPGLSIPYFMEKHPYEVLENGEQRNVPMILGATKHDGSFALDDIYNNYIKPNGIDKNATFLRNDLLPTLLQNLGIRDETGELYHTMTNTYLGDAALTGTMEDKLPGMLDMVTVMAFKAGELETLKFQSKLNSHSYFYSMDYAGRWSLYNFLWGDMYIPGGICHTDDLIYFFWLGPLLNEDMKVSRRWTKYLINFAYHGDPNGPTGSDIIWEPYDSFKHPYLKLDRHDKMVYNAPDHWKGAADEIFVDWNPNPDPEPTDDTPVPTNPSTVPTDTTPPPTVPTDSGSTPSPAPSSTEGGSGGPCLISNTYFTLVLSWVVVAFSIKHL